MELDLPEHPKLDEFLKAVKQATRKEDYSGIPIYVDPIGLQEVHISLGQEVFPPNPGSLGFVLEQTLRPCHLSYFVLDGWLMINSRDEVAQRRLEILDRKVDRLLESLERIEHDVQPRSPDDRRR